MSGHPREDVTAAIVALEAQRQLLGDAVVDAALRALRKQLADLEPPAAAQSVELDAERRTVTVMFADVSGFTALSERLDAEQVRSRMNACFNELVPVVERYGGTVDKFIGDEIMALFGAPIAHENDPERALRAALDMQHAMASFNAREGTSLGLHFGINTGPVVAGSVGADARQQYSVMGDAVNLAARLEDASETGEILVGPETYRLTCTVFEFGAPRAIALKGKSDAVTVRSLVAVKAAVRGGRPLDGLRSPLVGRDEELSVLRRAFDGLRQGRGRVVALRGEAGVGKSRLVAEARQSLPAAVVWAEGRGLSLAQGTAYGVARDLLYDLLDLTADASSSRIGDALAAAVARWCPDHIADTLPYLTRLVDLPVSAAFRERLASLSGEVLQGRMIGSLVEYVRARSRHEPLVLAWEDLHWVDPSSLRLLDALLPLTEQAAVIVLMSYRPDERGEHVHDTLVAPYAGPRSVVDLGPLTRAQSDEAIRHLLAAGGLPPETRSLVLDRTEGNPFFIEEVVRGLIDAGQVDVTCGATTRAAPDAALALPTTLQGVIMARLDRLSPDSRGVLQTASVIGRHFQERVLAHVMTGDAGRGCALDACLDELQRRDFVHTREREATSTAESNEFVFKHALTQDVAYGSLLVARRRQLHGLVGTAIEALYADRLDELAGTVGHHFRQAGQAARAVEYLTRAGNRAQAAFANAEAAALYRTAIDELNREGAGRGSPDDMRPTLYEDLGDVLELGGEHEEARTAYEYALAIDPDASGIPAARRHRKRGATLMVQRRYDEALAEYSLADSHIGARDGEGDAHWWRERLNIQLARLWVFYWRGQTTEMTALVEAHGHAFEQHGSARQRAHFYAQLTLRNLRRDCYRPGDDTAEYAARVRRTIPAVAERGEVPHFAFVAGFATLWLNQLDQAAQELADALAISNQVGDVVVALRCTTYIGVTARQRGDLDTTREYATRTLEQATRMKMQEYVAMAHATLGWLAWRAGDLSEAEERTQLALDLWHGMPVPYTFDWMAAWPLAAVRLAHDDTAGAIACVRMILASSQQPTPDDLANIAQRALAAWEADRAVDARRLLEQAVTIGRDRGYT